MAGVAVTMPIVQLMSALATGIMTAVSILITRYYGSKEEGQMRNVVFHGWVIAAVLIILVTGGGILFCDPLLRAMGTPEDVLTHTSGYMTHNQQRVENSIDDGREEHKCHRFFRISHSSQDRGNQGEYHGENEAGEDNL